MHRKRALSPVTQCDRPGEKDRSAREETQNRAKEVQEVFYKRHVITGLVLGTTRGKGQNEDWGKKGRDMGHWGDVRIYYSPVNRWLLFSGCPTEPREEEEEKGKKRRKIYTGEIVEERS